MQRPLKRQAVMRAPHNNVKISKLKELRDSLEHVLSSLVSSQNQVEFSDANDGRENNSIEATPEMIPIAGPGEEKTFMLEALVAKDSKETWIEHGKKGAQYGRLGGRPKKVEAIVQADDAGFEGKGSIWSQCQSEG